MNYSLTTKNDLFGTLISLITTLFVILLITYIAQNAWNGVMPDMFGMRQITMAQMLSLFVLIKLLF